MLKEIIRSYISDPNALFANPAPGTPGIEANWLVLFLVIVWGIFAVHYAFEPTYRKSLIRYFNNHNFFVSDIVERRTRVGLAPTIVHINQAIIAGLMFYALGEFAISHHGYQVLRHHLFFLDWFGDSRFVLFVAGGLLVFAYNSVCMLWLYLGSNRINYLNQASTLYIMPQHLNFAICSTIVTLIIAQQGSGAIFWLFTLFLLVLIGSFYLTVYDFPRDNSRTASLLRTAGLHAALFVGLAIRFFFFSGLPDVISLAISLP